MERSTPPPPPSDEDRAAAERIERARDEAERLAASLTRLWDGVVDAAAGTNNDDEHDPEGATIAFEREQLRARRDQVRAELDALNLAAERLREGRYRVCERCGGPIAPGRLEARPTARTCVECAARTRR
ncbi:TraR/DksA C4-type zinc finger protein [Streptomyces sp. NBRC 109706]|uniref:TraR/DksA family transcriptional regulator n=1 Tax=Streptomyces sp. NBRC 109706 TaxID=1550035 RepID=UPI000783A722|nr:TraR/DksA C4-type zinc finger protein [Streptomyces sp. NBRC 109706]